MNVNDILTFNTQVLYILLSVLAIIHYIRRPNPRRRDFALLASALGFPLSITFLRRFVPLESGLLDVTGAFVLFSQPYFLFRLLQYFRPNRQGISLLILVGFVGSCLLLWTQMAVNPIRTVTIIFTYCATVEAYCTWAYYQIKQESVGILRLRISIITISSAVFTLAFAINAVKAQVPTVSPSITPIAQAVAALSAILFYLAFTPPRWLRRAWQMDELYNFLLHTRMAPVQDEYSLGRFQQLNQYAIQSTNGIAGAVLNLHKSSDKWTLVTASDPVLFANLIENGESFIKGAWEQGGAMYAYVPDIRDTNERRSLSALGVKTWLLAPIQSQGYMRGLLVIALHDRSLFIEDDLSLLDLMAHECALVLDNRRLINELQSYSEQLERRVEERTSELQRSNAELRNYAYIASHDLQEPLRTVTSYLQLIELRFPDKLNDEVREYFSFAVNGVMRMKNLIGDLLIYSRVDARERKFKLIDLQGVLDKTQKHLEGAIAETKTIITYDALPQIVADETLMLQLFQNLIGNSIKYRSAKDPEIHIGATCKNQQWTFSIRDNGIGIEEQFLERIFIIFQRLHTIEKYPGTGIGLAICKKAIELHDGQIWAESTIGQGTIFYFTIPERNISEGLELVNLPHTQLDSADKPSGDKYLNIIN